MGKLGEDSSHQIYMKYLAKQRFYHGHEQIFCLNVGMQTGNASLRQFPFMSSTQ